MKPILATIAVLLAVAGCGTTSAKDAPSGSTPTSTYPSAAPTLQDSAGIGAKPVPSLSGYQSIGTWTFRVNASGGQFTPGTGPGNVAWPANQDGCADQWYLIRWRAADGQTTFVAAYGAPGPTTKTASATRGWLLIDGCQVPQWQGAGQVAVDAQLYQPMS